MSDPRRPRLGLLVSLLSAVVVVLGLLPAGVSAAPAPAPSGPATARFAYLINYDDHEFACNAANGPLSVVVVHWSNLELAEQLGERGGCTLAKIRAANPGVKVYGYLNLAGIVCKGDAFDANDAGAGRIPPGYQVGDCRPATLTSTMERWPGEQAEHAIQVTHPSHCVSRQDVEGTANPTWLYLHPSTSYTGGSAAKQTTISFKTGVMAGRTDTVVISKSFGWYAGNVGNADYVTLCQATVDAMLADTLGTGTGNKLDGAFFDDTNVGRPGHGFGEDAGQQRISEYSDVNYGEVMLKIARATVAHVHGYNTDLKVGGNVGHDPWDGHFTNTSTATGRAVRLVNPTDNTGGQPFDYFYREFWMCWNACAHYEGVQKVDDRFKNGNWAWMAALMREVEKQGKPFYTTTFRDPALEYSRPYDAATTQSGLDDGMAEFAEASFLLMGSGTTGSLFSFWSNQASNPNVLEHLARSIGTPTDLAPTTENTNDWWNCANSTCKYLRRYSNGVVVVNASSGSAIFSLGGNYYPPRTKTPVSSVTLGSGKGMVLTKYKP